MEIAIITSELITCYFDDQEKKFVFGWHQKSKYPKLRIPYKRIHELIDWYITHNKNLKIKSIQKYRESLKQESYMMILRT